MVGLVIPTGYSFNLDGTAIYLTMAAVFIAQATNTPMTLTQELTLLAVLLLTSKGAAGITGSGFIVLAATCRYGPFHLPDRQVQRSLIPELSGISGISGTAHQHRTI